jgi:Outer membrane protein beta-barrel domain
LQPRGIPEVFVKRLEQLFGWSAFLLCIGTAAPVAAQGVPPSGPEFSIGYQLLHVPDETFPLGLNLDVASTFGSGWTIVGEFGWANDNQSEPGVDGSLTLINYGAGPRWAIRGAPIPARPFVQVLAGGVHTSAELTGAGISVDDSDNAFMLQPGAGVIVPLGGAWGFVGQVDYRRVFFKEQGDNEWRLVLGAHFGR